MFLDGILKGLVLWLYGLILEGVEYMADSLLNIFSLDLAYFETYAPVVREIQNIVIAVGWALLIGNLVFQAMRSMAAGLGFEGEDPHLCFRISPAGQPPDLRHRAEIHQRHHGPVSSPGCGGDHHPG